MLTPDEEKELAGLQQIVGSQQSIKSSNLTPDEEKELVNLQNIHQNIPQQSIVKAQPTSQLDAGTTALAKGASFGTLPHMVGAATAISDSVADKISGIDDIDQKLRDEGFTGDSLKKKSLLEQYKIARDAEMTRESSLAKTYPKTTMAGEIIGGLAMPFGGGLKTAATLGGISALSQSKTDLTEVPKDIEDGNYSDAASKIGESLSDTSKGAALGLVGGKIGEKIGDVVSTKSPEIASWVSEKMSNLGDYFKTKSGLNAVKSISDNAGLIMKDIGVSRFGDKIPPKNIGQTLLDKNILSLIKNKPDDVLNRIGASIEDNGKKLGEVLDSAQNKINESFDKTIIPEGSKIVNELEEQLLNIPDKIKEKLTGKMDVSDQIEDAKNMINEYIKQNPNIDFNLSALQKAKQKLGEQLSELDWNKVRSGELEGKKAAISDTYMVLKKRIEDLVDKSAPELSGQVKQLNSDMSNLYSVRTVISNEQKNSGEFLSKIKQILPKYGKQAGVAGAAHYLGLSQVVIPAQVANMALEAATGNNAMNMARIAAGAKGLNSLANKMISASDDISRNLGKSILNISNSASEVGGKAASLMQLLSRDENKKILEAYSKPENSNEDKHTVAGESYNADMQPDELIQKSDDLKNTEFKQYSDELKRTAEMNPQKRRANLFRLYQLRSFRNAMNNNKTEDSGE